MAIKNTSTPIIIIALFVSAIASHVAGACELEKNEFGYRLAGDDCIRLRPQDMIKMPNLIVTGAGVGSRYQDGFRLSVTVRNNGTADTDSTLFPRRLSLVAIQLSTMVRSTLRYKFTSRTATIISSIFSIATPMPGPRSPDGPCVHRYYRPATFAT